MSDTAERPEKDHNLFWHVILPDGQRFTNHKGHDVWNLPHIAAHYAPEGATVISTRGHVFDYEAYETCRNCNHDYWHGIHVCRGIERRGYWE